MGERRYLSHSNYLLCFFPSASKANEMHGLYNMLKEANETRKISYDAFKDLLAFCVLENGFTEEDQINLIYNLRRLISALDFFYFFVYSHTHFMALYT